MKQCCEYLREIMYKLSMVVIYYDSPDYTEGYNQSEIYNRTVPDSTLDKKNQSIAYNFVRELSAYDEWRTTYVKTHKNELDILTKCILLPYLD